LAKNRDALLALRRRVAANRLTTALFDSGRFVRHLEAGYEAMWRRCAAGLAPDHIGVPPA
jgi:predicted O-linked N-acetylglucosamine transferase (SPINDLY family)